MRAETTKELEWLRRLPPVEAVRNQRCKQGLTKPSRAWTAEEKTLLGTMPDEELARLVKRTAKTVRDRCYLKPIPMFAPTRRHWTAAEDALLGKEPDAVLARRWD